MKKMGMAVFTVALCAMCLAAGRPPRVNDVQELTGLCFPARVKVSPRPRLVDGRPFWNNEIALVVTPDKAEHARVAGGGEILAQPGPKVPDEQSDLPF